MDSQNDSHSSSRRPLLLCLCFTAVAAGLVLFNIGNTYFWDDESYTALFTKNLLETGGFSGWDGRNLIAFRNGSLLDENLNSINPPLSYFVCAAGFKLMGYTTAAGRIPFALLGLFSIPATFFLTRTLFPKRPGAAVFAAAYLALSVSFLLYIKQCRYYSPVISFSALTTLSYFLALRATKISWHLGLALFATLLFYAHYMIGIALMMSLAAVFLIFHARELSRRQWIQFCISGAVFSLLVLPYAVAKRIWVRPDFERPPFSQKFELLWWNLRELNTCAWLPWIVVILGIVLAVIHRRRGGSLSGLGEMGALFMVYLVVSTVLSPQDLRKTAFADTRYLVVLIPLCATLVGFILSLVQTLIPNRTRGTALAWAILLVSVFTNFLSLTPPGVAPSNFTSKPRWLLPAYIQEITHDYPEPYRAASDFIRKNLPKDATLLAAPGYANYPLMFYTGDQVLFRGLLIAAETQRRNANLSLDEVHKLDARLFADAHAPDFFITFGATPEAEQLIRALIQTHGTRPGTENPSLTYKMVATLDVFAHSMIRPELFWRSFKPVTGYDPRTQAVYVFQRVANPSPASTEPNQ